MNELEITQTHTVKETGDRPLTSTTLFSSIFSFLIDKGTPVVFGLLVTLSSMFIGMFITLTTLSGRVNTLEVQSQAYVGTAEYRSDQQSISIQLDSIKELIKSGNSRTERIEDYLLKK